MELLIVAPMALLLAKSTRHFVVHFIIVQKRVPDLYGVVYFQFYLHHP